MGHRQNRQMQAEPQNTHRGQCWSCTLLCPCMVWTDSELFTELKRDTRCLMGWNNNTIVLAFRGTASVTNALSDLQVMECG